MSHLLHWKRITDVLEQYKCQTILKAAHKKANFQMSMSVHVFRHLTFRLKNVEKCKDGY